MRSRATPPPHAEERYVRQTQRPLSSLAFVLLPLLIYQLGTLYYGTDLLAPRDLAKLLRYFGATASYLPPLLILVELVLLHVLHRHPWKLRPVYLAGMLAESVAWTVPLFSLNYLTSRFLAAGAASQPRNAAQFLLRALGAGIYEEFIFRLMFISLLLLILVDLIGLRRDLAGVIAVALGAVLFSLYHLTGAELRGAAPFPWDDAIFRGLAGAYLGGLFVGRGFGIAVGTHAWWNLYAAATGA
jgi:hypothetical protein